MSKPKFYPEVNQNLNFSEMEAEILKFWEEEKIFDKSVKIRDFAGELDDDNTSPVQEPCALKNHTNCRHSQNEKSEFVFYDGPPFANGLPHYGHLLTGFIKDLFARYQTMKGKKVERRFGWDTHGLPVEMETEKELGVSGQISIKEFGIEKFNQACRKSVMKYAGEWEKYVTRQGRFVDFKNSYKTMDLSFMESVIWAFKSLYDKSLLYEDFRVMPYSWACQTPLSNFETQMDNSYRQKASKAVSVKFKLTAKRTSKVEHHSIRRGETEQNFSDEPLIKDLAGRNLQEWGSSFGILSQDKTDEMLEKLGLKGKNVFLVAWTTTPWTLPSNLALAVNEKFEYSLLKVVTEEAEEILVIAKELVEKFAKDLGQYDEVGSIIGQDLVGFFYEPIFPFFKPKNNQKIAEQCSDVGAFRILHGDFVATDQGTGIVHIAPGFGEDDQLLCKANGIPTICPVDEGGKFTAEIFDLPELSLKNRQVFDTNDEIIRYLKCTNSWLKTEQILHNYPHCWRTDTPLIYKAIGSWYVKVSAFKERMVELNQTINWIPEHVKNGQFGKWLENARDWSITRNRFWGCPVPVWKSKSGKIKVFGSIAELEAISGKKITDLHRPAIDEVKFEIDGEIYERVSDVLDCWFESGSMPYAQVHYPFENKEWFEENFPADFITEYQAQTRGWFYTLMVLSTALFDRAPFKNVICHGTILDENSQKLSKRLRNYMDPIEVFDKFGSDAMRFYMISQPVMRGLELRIDKDGKAISDCLRLSIKPLLNAFNFFCLYANADGIKAERVNFSRKFQNPLDRYILAKLKKAVLAIDFSLSKFDSISACEEFNRFFEVLNNWYIRRGRSRFWRSVEKTEDSDKKDAYDVLYSLICIICEASAPLMPFTCDYIWKKLKLSDD